MEITLSLWKTQTHDEFLFDLAASFIQVFLIIISRKGGRRMLQTVFLDSDKYGAPSAQEDRNHQISC